MTILEVTIALSLLAMGIVLTAQVFMQCAQQHQASEQQLTAQWEAANVLERLAGLRYDELTSDSVKTIEPSHQLRPPCPTPSSKSLLPIPTPIPPPRRRTNGFTSK